MQLMDGMISTQRFSEFVTEIVSIKNKEQEENTLWDMWLHKDFEKSYAEFRASIHTSDKNAVRMSEKQIKAALKSSFTMLNGFVPA